MNIDDFIENYPTLYHMAELGSWENIQNHGLLSTSALLDLYQINGEERKAIESSHRPDCISISKDGLPTAIVRDQKPMSDSALKKVLLDNLTPSDWYRILNSKVFFWSSEQKVHVLLNARAYRNKPHDVITVDTAKLVELYRDRIVLCPYNSGSTIMNPVKRGLDLFQTIENHDYNRWKKKRGKAQAVTEVCVEGGVKNINQVVTKVRQMQQNTVLKILFP